MHYHHNLPVSFRARHDLDGIGSFARPIRIPQELSLPSLHRRALFERRQRSLVDARRDEIFSETVIGRADSFSTTMLAYFPESQTPGKTTRPVGASGCVEHTATRSAPIKFHRTGTTARSPGLRLKNPSQWAPSERTRFHLPT